jgi:hypothetical protein
MKGTILRLDSYAAGRGGERTKFNLMTLIEIAKPTFFLGTLVILLVQWVFYLASSSLIYLMSGRN